VELSIVHTVSIHGDTPTASKLAKALRIGLEKAGIEVRPVNQFI